MFGGLQERVSIGQQATPGSEFGQVAFAECTGMQVGAREQASVGELMCT